MMRRNIYWQNREHPMEENISSIFVLWSWWMGCGLHIKHEMIQAPLWGLKCQGKVTKMLRGIWSCNQSPFLSSGVYFSIGEKNDLRNSYLTLSHITWYSVQFFVFFFFKSSSKYKHVFSFPFSDVTPSMHSTYRITFSFQQLFLL